MQVFEPGAIADNENDKMSAFKQFTEVFSWKLLQIIEI